MVEMKKKGLKTKLINQIFVLVLLVLRFSFPATSQLAVSQINFDIFTQEEGLTNNLIQCIYQDKEGWMWIGTSQGLSRFDGYNFVNFLPNANDTSSLNGNLVRVIWEDRNGRLLVGTENGGLNIFDRQKERFLNPYKNHPELELKEVSVNAIKEDKSKNVWIGTDFNIFVIDTTDNLSPIHPKPFHSEINFEGNYVRNLQFDKKGKLWIGTDNRIFIYNPSTNEIEIFALPFGENLNKGIWEIYLDEERLI